MLAHVSNAPVGWQSFDITPTPVKGFVLGNCDVLQQGNTVHLAMTVSSAKLSDGPKPGGESHSLWLATFAVPELSWSTSDHRVSGYAVDGTLYDPPLLCGIF
jgi:hypothetical protein